MSFTPVNSRILFITIKPGPCSVANALVIVRDCFQQHSVAIAQGIIKDAPELGDHYKTLILQTSVTKEDVCDKLKKMAQITSAEGDYLNMKLDASDVHHLTSGEDLTRSPKARWI